MAMRELRESENISTDILKIELCFIEFSPKNISLLPYRLSDPIEL